MDPKVMKWKLLNYSLVSLLHLRCNICYPKPNLEGWPVK